MSLPGRSGWPEVRRPLSGLAIACMLMAGCTAEGGTPMAAAPSPADLPTSTHRLTEAEALAVLETFVREEAAADRFSGAVLVAKDGDVLFSKAYGLADRERETPNMVQTRFRIGSMNKMFTAVAILQLVEAGKVDLMAPLGTYPPTTPTGRSPSRSRFISCSRIPAGPVTSSARSPRPTARGSGHSPTTWSGTARAVPSSTRGLSGCTATTASSCSAP